MQVNQIKNKEDLFASVVNELKEMGIKYRKPKTPKVLREKVCSMFHTHLHLLELVDIATHDGNVIQIPKLVENTCRFILKNCEVEGIFRKAGSSLRQKEIRVNLEAGLPLHGSCHVIDVANVLKFFFRELPEPLIPVSMQETLLRSLLISDRNTQAILLSCLLLPTLTLNTLSYFMKFLHTITLSADLNKMTVENLAIIFTPALMPFDNMTSRRFSNHIKVVQLLIENANSIGIVPYTVVGKIRSEISPEAPSHSLKSLESAQKKKKRRSDMFNGLKKIVSSGRGSSENLLNTPDNEAISYSSHGHNHQQLSICTPSEKSSKKRKFVDPAYAFSAKKKESKNARKSLGGNRQTKIVTPAVSMERRWSIIGSAWPKQKSKTIEETKKIPQSEEKMLRENKCVEQSVLLNSVIHSSPGYVPIDNNTILEKYGTNFPAHDKSEDNLNEVCEQTFEQEYEEIKNRVTAIESRISDELSSIKNPTSCSSTTSCLMLNEHIDEKDFSELDRIQNKYKEMILETDSISLPLTEQLAQRITRGLNICRSMEQRVIRSPSARKIGTIRRRSQGNRSLCRNQSWHISTQSYNATASPQSLSSLQQNKFYGKSHLKRGRPNTLQGVLLKRQLPSSQVEVYDTETAKNKLLVEQWTCGEVFFNERLQIHKYSTDSIHENKMKNMEKQSNFPFTPCTPIKPKPLKTSTSALTPMLPPLSVSRKLASSRTPSSLLKVPLTTKTYDQNGLYPEVNEGQSGRASIARLRTQNAGMVMAKAKLFDQIGTQNDEKDDLVCIPQCENLRKSKPSIITTSESRKAFVTAAVSTVSECLIPCQAKSLESYVSFSEPPPEVCSDERKAKVNKAIARQPILNKEHIKLTASPLLKIRYALNVKPHRKTRYPPSEAIPHVIYKNSPRLHKK